MKNFIKENKIAITIIIGAIVITTGLIVNSSMEQAREERKELQERMRQNLKEESAKQDFEVCSDNAYYVYSQDWDSTCKAQKLGEDCLLNNYLSKTLEERRNLLNKTCLDLYELELI